MRYNTPMNGMGQRTYLDWASAAPVSRASRRAFLRALRDFGNPGAPHEEGRRAKGLLTEARTRIARQAGTKPESVIFTSGATEANNLALQGLARARRTQGTEALHALYLPGAHASTVRVMEALSRYGVETEPLTLEHGSISLAKLRTQLRPDTFLVSVEAVCGETGARFDTRAVRRELDAYAKASGARIHLHVDASQLPLAESFEHTRLGADSIALDAQKVGGVRGIGALILPKRVELVPLVQGGGQEEGYRPGTEPVALACAFAEALEEAHKERDAFSGRARTMRERFVETLTHEIPDAAVNEGKENVPHIVNVSFLGRDTDYAVALLNAKGFAVSTKSSCETDSTKGSRAVLALTGEEARARSTLRVSWGPSTAPRALERLASELVRTIRFLDRTAV